MPQMAPMNWLTLFLFFSMIFIMFNVINFYSFLYKQAPKKPVKTHMTLNWKW